MGLLESAKAIVTGGGAGIGAAVCRRFAAEGARVAVLDKNESSAREVADEVGGTSMAVDVADGHALTTAIDAAATELGGLTTLVNNAGCGNLAELGDGDDAVWEKIVRVNLTAVFTATKAAAPIIAAGGGGTIVNNASASGVRATRGELPYSAAKAGVIALTQGAAQELAPSIRVNAVSPGLIRTAMSEPLFQMPGALDPVTKSTPLARTGTAEEVADVILFLACDLSRYMTGQNLVVDGGMTLPQAGIDEVLREMLGHIKRAR